jgi:hypothetical protein
LDQAQELFLQGIQLTQNGDDADSSLASEYIVSAYLRDERVVILQVGFDERMLDRGILTKMAEKAHHSETSPSTGILFMILSIKDAQSNRAYAGVAMKCISDMLDTMTEDMLLNSTQGRIEGLTRSKLHFLRGQLYADRLLNGRSAMKEWTKALDLDPSCSAARLARLECWAATEVKNGADIHAECQSLLGQYHADFEDLNLIYAILVETTLVDPCLGTYDEAMEYYRKKPPSNQ